MVKRTHGYRYKSRKLLRKRLREKGFRGLGRLLYEYKVGDLVHIDISPNYIKTAPHRRYQGKVGKIIEIRGRAYIIAVKVGGKIKKIITTKDHIMPYKGAQQPLGTISSPNSSM
ncbi:MAG: 50S ribosomal protein L21e [Thermoprotei archaeon]|nr:MAG: 50S ribosomal protein L21e [Thermoprotei archaeon]RLE81090.1 MAG: 50S ribosomal protein L21e [Thermoprotei archaeon]RLF02650.1 MAG: 50S ribosomal protein L21e [Thermoprotei archaeon]